MKCIRIFILLFVGFSMSSLAGVYEVGQKNKEFSTPRLLIKQGDIVQFKNEDPFFHNIFSLSDAALFDLGLFPQGEYKEFQFDTKGTVEVECAIHPNMRMTIEVE